MTHFTLSPSGSYDNSDGTGKVDPSVGAEEDMPMAGGGGGEASDDFSIQDAIRQKEIGNQCMVERDLFGAEAAYGNGLGLLAGIREGTMSVGGGGDAAAHNLNQTEAILRSNLSLVLNKLERYDEAERHCSIALELEPNQWKVHYRRAKARENLETPDLIGAEADLLKCIEILTTESSDGKGSIKAKALPSALADAHSSLERVRISIEEKGHIVLRDVPMAIGQPSPDETSSSEGPSFCAIPSPKEQRTAILRLLAAYERSDNGDVARLRPRSALIGEAFMLIDMKWWKVWCRHVDFFRDAELKEAIRAECDPSATDSIRQGAKSAKTSALRGRLTAAQLLPPGAYLSPIPSAKDVEKENQGKAKRRSSTASSSSSSSEESSEDDEWLNIEGAFGPLPGSIDNSLLILKTDGKAGTKDAHDEFFTEWCRPSEDSSAIGEADGGSYFVRLRPNLVRGHHFEVLPREAYGALVCWYGDMTPPICRRAAASHDDSGEDMVRILLYPELQHNDTGGLSPTWSGNDTGEELTLTAASLRFRCAACKSPGATAQCTRCLSVRYCRKECQISHWSHHKSTCKAISAVRTDLQDGTSSSSSSKVKTITDNCSEWGRIGLNNLGNTVSYCVYFLCPEAYTFSIPKDPLTQIPPPLSMQSHTVLYELSPPSTLSQCPAREVFPVWPLQGRHQ
jgi:tetratricopeptide (TPR) repeat protein